MPLFIPQSHKNPILLFSFIVFLEICFDVQQFVIFLEQRDAPQR